MDCQGSELKHLETLAVICAAWRYKVATTVFYKRYAVPTGSIVNVMMEGRMREGKIGGGWEKEGEERGLGRHEEKGLGQEGHINNAYIQTKPHLQ